MIDRWCPKNQKITMDESSLDIHCVDSRSIKKLQKENEHYEKLISKQLDRIKKISKFEFSKDELAEINKKNEDNEFVYCIESLFIFDVDDTLSPTTSIISQLYDENEDTDEDDLRLDEKNALITREIDDLVVGLLDHILGSTIEVDDDFEKQLYPFTWNISNNKPCESTDCLKEFTSSKVMLKNKIILVTAAGKDGFLVVCKHLPKLKKFLMKHKIKIWANDWADENDDIKKLCYKSTVFKHELFKDFIREQNNRIHIQSNFLNRENKVVEKTNDIDDRCNPVNNKKDLPFDISTKQMFTAILFVSIGDGSCEQDAAFACTRTLFDVLHQRKNMIEKKKQKGNRMESKMDDRLDQSCQKHDKIFLGSVVIKLREEIELGPEHILVQLRDIKSLFSKSLSNTSESGIDESQRRNLNDGIKALDHSEESKSETIFSLESIVDKNFILDFFHMRQPNNHQSENRGNSLDERPESTRLKRLTSNCRLPGFYRSVPPDFDDQLLSNLMQEYTQVFIAEYNAT